MKKLKKKPRKRVLTGTIRVVGNYSQSKDEFTAVYRGTTKAIPRDWPVQVTKAQAETLALAPKLLNALAPYMMRGPRQGYVDVHTNGSATVRNGYPRAMRSRYG